MILKKRLRMKILCIMKNKFRIIVTVLLVIFVSRFVGCTETDRAYKNVSQEADNEDKQFFL